MPMSEEAKNIFSLGSAEMTLAGAISYLECRKYREAASILMQCHSHVIREIHECILRSTEEFNG